MNGFFIVLLLCYCGSACTRYFIPAVVQSREEKRDVIPLLFPTKSNTSFHDMSAKHFHSFSNDDEDDVDLNATGFQLNPIVKQAKQGGTAAALSSVSNTLASGLVKANGVRNSIMTNLGGNADTNSSELHNKFATAPAYDRLSSGELEV